MPKKKQIDEFWLTVFIPSRLKNAEAETVSRTLCSKRFQTALRRSLRDLFAQFPALAKASFSLDG